MSASRRTVLASLSALAAAPAAAVPRRPIVLIQAPNNLGLRPLQPGHEPGAWRAPAALEAAGLGAALAPARTVALPRPPYAFDAQQGTRIRNGRSLRRFSERLAGEVAAALAQGARPVVVGGDCSTLLGCLLGARRQGPFGLVHVDGHSDFFHPGNYDAAARLGSAAGMDLALATGRGEPLLAQWDGRPLVDDAHVVQVGEREDTDPDYAFPDIRTTAIRRVPVREVLAIGVPAVIDRILAPADGEARRLWLHIDLDVLDQRVMPAVDSPGSPGLDFAQLAALVRGLLASGRVIGLDLCIYDPELDPDGAYAKAIVRGLGPAIRQA